MVSPTRFVIRLVLVLHSVITINAFTFNSSVSDREVKCIKSERQALIKFKDNLNYANGLLSSWGNGKEKRECCKWYGIQCDNKSGHVIKLHLSGTEEVVLLEGNISDLLIDLPYLNYLNLSGNNLEGKFLKFLSNMSSLQYLDLSGNNLQGEIPKSLWSICSLQILSLSNNNISGQLSPSSNCSHHSLERLDLSYNQIIASMPNFTLFTSLKYLDLSSNKLSGVVPPSLGQLSKLQLLSISKNSFHSVISKVHFLKLSKLIELDFSDNPSLILDIENNWVPPFQLNVVKMKSCKLGPYFPKWIRTRKNCERLDLSNTGIQDSLPNYFWDQISCGKTNISNNQITGTIVNSSLQIEYFDTIDLSSNRFVGPISSFLFEANRLFLYGNKFFSLNSMCDVSNGESSLVFLDVSNNHLSGQLPDCWSYFQNLNILILSNNELSGRIPYSIGYLSRLEALHLDGNNLIGALPKSLKNCTFLQFLNAGDNELLGPFPKWIGENLGKLVILSLRSNHFYCSIPTNLCLLKNLQILDLSANNISGNVPKCLHNFIAMQKNGGYFGDTTITLEYVANPYSRYILAYEEELVLMWKRISSTYKNTLGLVKSIDISSNKLNGIIPTGITQLTGLVSLNLSRNNLTGSIPTEMGQMKSLDFIDLSNNQIYGHIPASFDQLDRLSVLDLSNNHLSGKIPKSTQLQSFNSSSYMGNPLLCGEPLKKCPGEEPAPPAETPIGAKRQENETKFFLGQGFYFSMGLGFVVGFWGFCGTLMFNKSWRYAYFNFMTVVGDYVAIMIALQ